MNDHTTLVWNYVKWYNKVTDTVSIYQVIFVQTGFGPINLPGGVKILRSLAKDEKNGPIFSVKATRDPLGAQVFLSCFHYDVFNPLANTKTLLEEFYRHVIIKWLTSFEIMKQYYIGHHHWDEKGLTVK